MFKKFSLVSLALAAGIVSFSLVFPSCGGDDGEEHPELKDVEQTTDTISSEVRIKFDIVRANIPQPAVLTSKLSAAKISYNKGLLLSSGKTGSFSSNYQKALGLGAFGADLGIAAAYNDPQTALEYLTQMGKLAGDLGIGSAFDPETTKLMMEKMAQPDSFQILLNKSFDKAERNLRSNQRVATTILMIAGGWVESVYISVESVSAKPNEATVKPIYADISAHCYAFKYIFELLDAYKSNPDCAKLIQDMESAKAALTAAGDNPKMGAADLPKLREAVTALRNKLTS